MQEPVTAVGVEELAAPESVACQVRIQLLVRGDSVSPRVLSVDQESAPFVRLEQYTPERNYHSVSDGPAYFNHSSFYFKFPHLT